MLGSRLGAKRGGGYGPGIVTEDERSRRVRAGYVRGAWRVRAGYGWGTGGAMQRGYGGYGRGTGYGGRAFTEGTRNQLSNALQKEIAHFGGNTGGRS